jgi:hypothetical protein
MIPLQHCVAVAVAWGMGSSVICDGDDNNWMGVALSRFSLSVLYWQCWIIGK